MKVATSPGTMQARSFPRSRYMEHWLGVVGKWKKGKEEEQIKEVKKKKRERQGQKKSPLKCMPTKWPKGDCMEP